MHIIVLSLKREYRSKFAIMKVSQNYLACTLSKRSSRLQDFIWKQFPPDFWGPGRLNKFLLEGVSEMILAHLQWWKQVSQPIYLSFLGCQEAYRVLWSVETFRPITEHTLYYRDFKVLSSQIKYTFLDPWLSFIDQPILVWEGSFENIHLLFLLLKVTGHSTFVFVL